MRAREPQAASRPPAAWELATAGTPTRFSISSSRPWLGLFGLLATALLIVMSASQTRSLIPQSLRDVPQSLRPVPGFIAGLFGSVGLDIGLPGLIVLMGLMFVSYALAVGASNRMSRRAVLISIAALNAIVLVAPPLMSTDLFSYIAYGRLGATYGINPYLHGPNVIWFDPLYRFVGSEWTSTPTVYGPLFTALSYPLASLGIAANVFAYKAIAAVSCLVLVLLVWHAARLRGLDPIKAVALVGLNPVIVVYGVGGGHNDLLMAAILVAAIYVLLRQREGTGGAMIVAATAVKLTAGVLLPFAVAAGAGRRLTSVRRSRILAGAAIAAALLGVFGAVMFGAGPLNLLATLSGIQGGGGLHSIPGFILTAVGLGSLTGPTDMVLQAAYAVGLVWLIHHVWVGKLDWITAAGWATVGLLVTAGLLMPWYVVWLIPLAALSTDRRLRIAAIVLTCLGLTTL